MNRHRLDTLPSIGLGIVSCLAVLDSPLQASAAPCYRVEERLLSVIPADAEDAGLSTFSSDCDSVAHVIKKGMQRCLIVNGIETGAADEIYDVHLLPKPVYVTHNAGLWRVVADNTKSEPFDELLIPDAYSVFGTRDRFLTVAQTRDSGSVGYVARRAGKYYAVINGAIYGPHANVKLLTFSPEGDQFAFVTSLKDKIQVVRNGVHVASYDDVHEVVFSRAGRLALVATRDGACFTVVGEQRGNAYTDVKSLCFSKDGSRMACYVLPHEPGLGIKTTKPDIAREHKYRIELDGKLLDDLYTYNTDPWHLRFSPDGKRFACVLNADVEGQRRWVAVLDGVIIGSYRLYAGISFSPDSNRVVIEHAQSVGETHITIDGVQSNMAYDIVRFLYFSDDSQHVVYDAVRNGKSVVVFDGRAEMASGEVHDLCINRSGDLHAYVIRSDGGESVAINGHILEGHYELIRLGSTPFTLDGSSFVFGARRGRDFYKCTVALK